MGKNYMLEGKYDDSHRVSLTEDTFKPAMSYPYNTMPEANYPNKNYMQMDMLDDSYRDRLSEDTSQMVLSYPYSTVCVHAAAYTFSTQNMMHENIPGLDLPLYTVEKTSSYLDASQYQDLAKDLKVSTPQAA